MKELTGEFIEVFDESNPCSFETVACQGTLPLGVDMTQALLVKIAKATKRLRGKGYPDDLFAFSSEQVEDIIRRFDGPNEEKPDCHSSEGCLR